MSTISLSNSLAGAGEAMASLRGIMVVEKGAIERSCVRREAGASLPVALMVLQREARCRRFLEAVRSTLRLKEDIAVSTSGTLYDTLQLRCRERSIDE